MCFWGCSDRLLEIDCQRNESCVYVRGSLSSQVPVTTNSPAHSSYLDKRKQFSAVISCTPGTWNLKPSINTFTISTKIIQGWNGSTGVSWRELSKGGIGSGLPTSSHKYNSSPGPHCHSSAAHPQLTRPIGHLLIKVIETPVRDPASCDFSFVNHHFSQVFHFQINVVRGIETANIFLYYFLTRINCFSSNIF